MNVLARPQSARPLPAGDVPARAVQAHAAPVPAAPVPAVPARSVRACSVLARAVLGSGTPVTVFAHGLGGSSAETRPLARSLPGTRVLLEFRGHGGSGPLPLGGWDYDVFAEDLLTVADEVGADRAVGLSLGAGALLRVLAVQPDRFARLAFVLPAALDRDRADGALLRLQSLAAAIDGRDADAVGDLLLAEVPVGLRGRRGVAALVRRRAEQLVLRPAPLPRGNDRPVEDLAVLARVTAPALVLAQQGDSLHPVQLAARLAAALPSARLLTLPVGGVFWDGAGRAQAALADHLSAGHS